MTMTLFFEPTTETEVIPSPQLFINVVQRQWSSPGILINPSSVDKSFYNVTSDLFKILQIPKVDAPVAALHTSPTMPGDPEENLRPEDKRAEQTLQRAHQVAVWVVHASMTAWFSNRASLLSLHQMQERIPVANVRSHQDLNKLVAVIQFSVDATLNAAQFVS